MIGPGWFRCFVAASGVFGGGDWPESDTLIGWKVHS